MTVLVADAEWDGDKESVVHCISCKPWGTGTVDRFTDMSLFNEYVLDMKPKKWAFHNGLTSDIRIINKLTPVTINPKDIIDTFVVSRTVNYGRFRTHSLKEIGSYLKVYKGDYSGGWGVYTEEMGEYCDQDVIVEEAILDFFKKDIYNPSWAKALRVEHDMAYICADMQSNGFTFDVPKATRLLEEIEQEKDELEESFKKAFKPKLVEVKRLKYKTTSEGKLYATVVKAIAEHPKTEVEGDELVCYDYKEFNPGSPIDRIDALWDAGWEPHEKTKGHIKAGRPSWLK